MFGRHATVFLTGALVVAIPASAAIKGKERKQARRLLEGRLHVRADIPCGHGRHPYGTYLKPLVEVSPSEINTDADETFAAGWWHADSTYWGIRINDPVEFDDWDWEDDWVEIELRGVGAAKGNETTLKLVRIHSLADFEAAFERIFSTRPLQEEHEDWPADVRQAIGVRKLLPGMTKRQVYYVTGRPVSFERSEEGGKAVEVWHLRQSKGVRIGYWGADTGEVTGLPATIRFVDGALVATGPTTASGDELRLDE